ncbi:MAG: ATP-dependent nuclease [Candidatus Thorarchaeota archaeon]
MRLSSVRVQNYRSIKDETLRLDTMTILVGPNGSGKSSFLRAIDLFYSSSPKYSEEDFYNRNTSEPIKITLTYSDLDEWERERYKLYVRNDELCVTRVLEWPPTRYSSRYHGLRLRNPDFRAFRNAKGSDLRREYEKLRSGKYRSFPPYANREKAEQTLTGWEENNLDSCEYEEDDGQFFGYTPVGRWLIEKGTRYVFIPAVRDAAEDAREGKGSYLTPIMELVVKSALRNNQELKDFQEKVNEEFRNTIQPAQTNNLKNVENELNEIYKTFVPRGELSIEWDYGNGVQVPLPNAFVKLTEDGFSSPVGSAGHGSQRAYLMALLHFLSKVQAQSTTQGEGDIESQGSSQTTGDEPTYILAIEEPELYQHPTRQRHFFSVLTELAEGRIEGVAERTQVIISTHSPLFVDIRRCSSIRRLRKEPMGVEEPPCTVVKATRLEDVAHDLEVAQCKHTGAFSAQSLEPRLKTLMTPWMNEGFFAEAIVLVEGEEDRAAIIGVSEIRGVDIEAMGIAIIPCNGKNNLDRPALIFRHLCIPTYVIWDSDEGKKGAKPEINHMLLRLMGEDQVEDWPHRVTDCYACFRHTLIQTMKSEIGDALFDETVETVREEFSMKKEHAMKHPAVVKEVLRRTHEKGHTCQTLEAIVDNIRRLVGE